MIEVIIGIAAALAVALVYTVVRYLILRDQVDLLRASCARKNRRICYLVDRMRILEASREHGPLRVLPGGRMETK